MKMYIWCTLLTFGLYAACSSPSPETTKTPSLAQGNKRAPKAVGGISEPTVENPPSSLAEQLQARAKELIQAAAADPLVARLGQSPLIVATMMRYEWTTMHKPNTQVLATMFVLPDGSTSWSAKASIVHGTPLSSGTMAGVSRNLELMNLLYVPVGCLIPENCQLTRLPLKTLAALPEIFRVDAVNDIENESKSRQLVSTAVGPSEQAAWIPGVHWFGVLLTNDARGTGRYSLVLSALEIAEDGSLQTKFNEVKDLDFGSRVPVLDGAGNPSCATAIECFSLGSSAYHNKNYRIAARFLESACTANHSASCATLSSMHRNGQVEKNERRATHFDRRVVEIHASECDAGDGLACGNLGRMYDNGSGGADKNPKKAIAYFKKGLRIFRKSCKSGDGEQCWFLGISLENGYGVAKSFAKAAQSYQKACDLGVASGCFNLGGLYFRGQGVKKSKKLAADNWTQACELGDQKACAL
ncbi:MAG: sel1 repeat family protein [Kofleriaceae bacterium]|nr:sel1 repeat family protein [Kofleriaceae bacterium]